MTKRNGTRKCPMCSSVFHGDVEVFTHVVECALKEHACDFCDFTSQKECNVKKTYEESAQRIDRKSYSIGSEATFCAPPNTCLYRLPLVTLCVVCVQVENDFLSVRFGCKFKLRREYRDFICRNA